MWCSAGQEVNAAVQVKASQYSMMMCHKYFQVSGELQPSRIPYGEWPVFSQMVRSKNNTRTQCPLK